MTDSRPWYREPLVWLIIAFPLAAVIGGIATYIIADRTQDGLVVDDYYKQGKEINLALARDTAAARLELRGALVLDAAKQAVILRLQAKAPEMLPPVISLRWLHATRAGLDRSQTLQRQKDGHYSAEFPELGTGHWYIQLEAQDWRLQGSLRVPDETTVELGAPDLRPID